MNSPNFKLCEVLATRLLSKQHLISSIIDVRELVYDKTIIFDSIQNYCYLTKMPLNRFINQETQLLSEGCTIYDPDSNIYIVLYNDKEQTYEHLNWTLAHEIGHIYLEHTSDTEIEEIEAHFFAAQFLMPEYSIYEISKLKGSVSVEDIYYLFNVSWTAATKRINTLNKKYSIRCDVEDKHIWSMMSDHIYHFFNDSLNYNKTYNYSYV